jgi:hypothetical protein
MYHFVIIDGIMIVFRIGRVRRRFDGLKDSRISASPNRRRQGFGASGNFGASGAIVPFSHLFGGYFALSLHYFCLKIMVPMCFPARAPVIFPETIPLMI